MTTITKSFGHVMRVSTIGLDILLDQMANIVGLNKTAFMNVKLAEYFNVEPFHRDYGGKKPLTKDEIIQIDALRAQYMAISEPEQARTILKSIIEKCQEELDRMGEVANV